MGSLFSTKTPAPPPPAPPTTVRDEVGGVEQVPVTNPDGSVTYITRKIPLTAEQQAQQDELDSIMKESLTEIQKLSASDYANDSATQKVLDEWAQAQQKLMNKQSQTRAQNEEEALARRGISDSSAAAEVRRQRALDEQTATQNLSQQKDEMSNQVRGERLALQQNLYNLAATQTNAAAVRVQQSAIKGQSDVAALNAQRQASILDWKPWTDDWRRWRLCWKHAGQFIWRTIDMDKQMDIRTWHREKFLPWKAAMESYHAEQLGQMQKLQANLGQLETIVAMLLEGRTRQAMLAWNTLGLPPKLSDLQLSDDGETLRLVDASGDVTVLKLEKLVAELQALVEAP